MEKSISAAGKGAGAGIRGAAAAERAGYKGGAEWFHRAGFADFCGDRGKPVPLGHGKLSVFPLRICPQHLLHTPGLRGSPEYIPFLIEEAKRFERSYPKESYDQGPYIAVEKLRVRFMTND